ncbi:MAG: DUF4136 domain-containing protein [Bacteroidetes bacterium]|nr:DUF4136 domain-containing protein [Bacteroidota bacterium]
MKLLLSLVLCVVASPLYAQLFKVEYDKSKNLGYIKTFQVVPGEITTPKDQKQIPDPTIHQWIQTSIRSQLEYHGLQSVDTLADVVVTYVFGVLARTDFEVLGPLAQTPGRGIEEKYTYNYQQSTFIIDLNDRSGNLIWRVNSTNNLTAPLNQKLIYSIAERGFRKFKKMQRLK